jgi:hypothetical protein
VNAPASPRHHTDAPRDAGDLWCGYGDGVTEDVPQLDDAAIAHLAAQLTAANPDDDLDDIEQALADAARQRPEALTGHLGALAAVQVFWPPALYRAADDTTRAWLVDAIDAGDVDNLNHALLALAHAGGTVAEDAFRRWASQPPPGADELYVPPDAYTMEGGWTLAPVRGIRPLCGVPAYALASVEGAADNVASLATRVDEPCPWCGSPLWTVLDVDTADERVAAALAHAAWSGRLSVVACYFCACYAPLYCAIDADGHATWARGNQRPEYLGNADPEEPDTVALSIGAQRLSPYLASAWSSGGSTLGGHPDWIQDAEYPTCLSCGQAMSYVGLLGGADLSDGEGAYYLFVHTPCRVGAVSYQQS